MNRRPWSLTLYAVIMFGIAFSFPIQVAYLQDLGQLFKHLTTLNWMVIMICLALAGSALQAHRRVLALSILAMAVMALNNWWVGEVELDYSPEQTQWATYGFLAVHSLFFEQKAWAVLRDQTLRWWQRAPRMRVPLEAMVSPWVGEARKVRLFDISSTGAFIQCSQQMLDEFEEGENMQLRIGLNHYSDLKCTARLIRKSQAKGEYPAGIGVQFDSLSRKQRAQLAHHLDH